MKIGIITHHWLGNFGANLQALSTVRVLRSLGHDPIILNYRIPVIAEKYAAQVSPEQLAIHEQFCRDFLPESEVCIDQKSVAEVASRLNLDAVVSGSDAVLRLEQGSDREDLSFPNSFWLTWAQEQGIRTGFLAASSMGSAYYQLDKEVRRGVRKAVSAVDVCSVRDRWTALMLMLCGVSPFKVKHCPDPVSALSGVLEDTDLPEVDSGAEPYILLSRYSHMLSDEWIADFVKAANAQGYKVYGLPQPDEEMKGPFDRILKLPMSPLEWYQWIAKSSGYVGVRFHPIMIAQTQRVPFVALDEYDAAFKLKGRIGSRVARLLRPLARNMSKTFDVSRRVGLERYVFAPRMYRDLSPERAISLLAEQRAAPLNPIFNQRRSDQFSQTVAAIVGK